ncbi:MAG: cupin domain-containing protein [Agriterribacter sp.]
MNKTITNPVVNDQVTFTQTAKETGGRITALLVTLMPGGGTPMHYHKQFAESFAVVEGELTIWLNKEKMVLRQGHKYTVEKNVMHRFCNTSGLPVVFTTVIMPGSSGFEHALRILYGLAQDGATDSKGRPKSLKTLAVISKMSDLHPTGILRLFTPLFGLLNRQAEKEGCREALLRKYCS